VVFHDCPTSTQIVPGPSSVTRTWPLLVCIVAASVLEVVSQGVADATSTKADYSKIVAPIFKTHCTSCHGSKKQKSQLRLDTPQGILAGGNSGEPAFISGNAEESYLIHLVSGKNPDQVMPPEGPRLTDQEIETLKQWINEGALMPGSGSDVSPTLTTDHWSFQPVNAISPPQTEHPFLLNPIDAFVFRTVAQKGLQPSPITDRRTLIRRLYLTVHGLPPSPEEVEQFVNDKAHGAYQRQIDRVLNSPRYGERWARHWLDVVRYADTNGFETNRERKTAYRYRDYVINAFNQDKPYNEFILEQIAGDSTGDEIGTGFLVAGPYDIVKSPDINLTLMQRQDELADMINTTGTTFLGLTIGCARCHNHKFDPILQKDYYAVQAVFAGVNHGERSLRKPVTKDSVNAVSILETELSKTEKELSNLRSLAESKPSKSGQGILRASVNAQKNEETFPHTKARFIKFTIDATTGGAEPCIDELEVYNTDGKNIALASQGTVPSASGSLTGYPIHKLEHINDGQTGNNRSWISNSGRNGWVQLRFVETQSIHRVVWGRDRNGSFADRLATDYRIEASLDGEQWQSLTSSEDRARFDRKSNPNDFVTDLPPADAARARALIAKSNRLNTQISDRRNGPKAWVANFSQAPVTHRLYRGEPTQKREAVAPDALTVMGSLGMSMDEPESQRRSKFAKWIANKANPLTARVLVNRLWHYTFGRGIVETPSDLGVNGIPPSHPELLDWLAQEFMASGWSIKHIQRLILSSHTFQQSSDSNPEAAQVDAGTKYLWRFPPRRLEAEAIRDSMLAVSGALDLKQGGPGFYLHEVQVENVMHYFPKETFGPPEFRRMVYLFKIRQEQDAIFGSFDCPDGNQTIPKRSRSNTPLQALNLFNSPFVIQQAEHLTRRLEAKGIGNPAAQIDRAFQLFFSRPPDSFELETSKEMIQSEGLRAFCRALYNTSEFLFVF
jgi:mono/diheme cytochrome c family protein